jgi:hypothetical protein
MSVLDSRKMFLDVPDVHLDVFEYRFTVYVSACIIWTSSLKGSVYNLKRKKEEYSDDDKVEELHVSNKKKKIEEESSSKKKREKHSVFYDLHTLEGKKKWGILGKIEVMTSERQANWAKGWCDINNFPSTLYNKEEGYNKEWFEEDNKRINVVYNNSSSNSSISSSLISSSSPSISSSTSSSISYSSISSSSPSDEPTEDEFAFYEKHFNN